MFKAWISLVDSLYQNIIVTTGGTEELGEAFLDALRALECEEYAQACKATEEMVLLSGMPESVVANMNTYIQGLYTVIPDFEAETVPMVSGDRAIENLWAAAKELQRQGLLGAAFDFYEVALYIVYLCDRSEPEIARKMYELSRAGDTEQREISLWRYCIEIIHYSIICESHWLEAINAFEVALTVPITDPLVRQDLSDRMREILEKGKGGRLDLLRAVYIIQGPRDCVPSEKREELIRGINELKSSGVRQEGADEKSWNESLEILALIRSQSIIEEIRYSLLDKKSGNPSVTWHDLTLHHNFLDHSVPIGQSLIIDVDRTGSFVLELVHEITHALCFIGTIGYARTAFRAAIHALELEMIAPGRNPFSGDILEPAASLFPSQLAITLAEAQLKITIKSSILEAMWTPWLEGLAMFVELLADPKDDPFEIFPVHEAVRSLVDFHVDKKDIDDSGNSSAKLADQFADQFDLFLSTALRRKSSLRLLSYMETNVGEEKSGTYMLGYLLVRSIVSAWEHTIGERIKPVVAAKILLHATQYGTLEFIPDLVLDINDFERDLKMKFQSWLDSLAALSKDDLNVFIVPVSRHESGMPIYWENGKPIMDNDSAAARKREKLSKEHFEKFTLMCNRLVHDAGAVLGDSRVIQPTMISDIFTTYMGLMTLLPVGRDYVRILLANEEGRVILSPRTYVGLTTPARSKNPKHSIHILTLEGGQAEMRKIQSIAHDQMTARALMTRVIDISAWGNPVSGGMRFTSFLCMFLGDDWERITFGSGHKPLGEEHRDFIRMIRKRVFPPPFYKNEGNMFSPAFLLKRLEAARPEFFPRHRSFDKIRFSYSTVVDVMARQLKLTPDEVRRFFDEVLNNDAAKYGVRDYLYATGVGKKGNVHVVKDLLLAQFFFFAESHSGIKPYNKHL